MHRTTDFVRGLGMVTRRTLRGGQRPRYLQTMAKLTALQKRAGKVISGAYARVAEEAYNIELNLLPIDLQMEIASHRTALKIMSTSTFKTPEDSPSQNVPLTRLIAQIEARTGKSIFNLELKKPYTHAPWESLPFAHIAKDYLKALIDHERLTVDSPALTFYSDGSGIDGHIGAAAVYPAIGAIRRRYMGTAPEYTVYSESW